MSRYTSCRLIDRLLLNLYLSQWDSVHNITIRSLADGIEETAIQGLVSPGAGGPPLVSAVGDIGGEQY